MAWELIVQRLWAGKQDILEEIIHGFVHVIFLFNSNIIESFIHCRESYTEVQMCMSHIYFEEYLQ